MIGTVLWFYFEFQNWVGVSKKLLKSGHIFIFFFGFQKALIKNWLITRQFELKISFSNTKLLQKI